MPTAVVGPKGQLYAEPNYTADPTTFQRNNTSGTYYESQYYKLHKAQVQPIPQARDTNPINVADFLPADILSAIQSAGKLVFHAVGDTGAAKVKTQSVVTALQHETRVADAMAADVKNGGNAGPAFFFHLGDVIYEFGEGQYYYDQFYTPFREYDRPIFAIPGNHDGMCFGSASSAPQVPTLAAFLTNFCAPLHGPSPDSPTSTRSVMTQPGVYFAVDAPFVTILGVYTNVIDAGPGVMSSQGGKFPLINDQLDFLTEQLTRLKPMRQRMERAVIIVTHHPPLSVDSKHGGSSGLTDDIDACCQKAGLWPDLVLSGHAHLYQHFTRKINGRQTPYIVAGSGGYAATTPMGGLSNVPLTIGDHTLEKPPIVDYGYLTIEVQIPTLTVTFKTADERGIFVRDTVTVNLNAGTETDQYDDAPTGSGAAPKRKAASPKGKKAAKKARPRR